MSVPIDGVWHRIAWHQGERFEAVIGRPYAYNVFGAVLQTDRTDFLYDARIRKTDWQASMCAHGEVDSLTENDVVEFVRRHLESSGWVVESWCTTQQTGEDIVARDASEGIRLSIEAKGATSARVGSARYGRPFDSAQVRVHVSEAVFKAVQVLSAGPESVVAGIALPANDMHYSMIRLVLPVLDRLKVQLFWVHDGGRVTVGSPPPPS